MCGGRGKRLEFDGEKPLYEIDGEPMIDRVIDALQASRIEEILAVGSPHVPGTMAHVEVPAIEGVGEGYVSDLLVALESVEKPVLTVGADLPLLDGSAVDWVLDRYETGSAMVAVPAERKTELGVSIDETTAPDGQPVVPSGVNVVGDPEPEHTLMSTDPRFAVNVNRPRDARIATHLARQDGSR
ncbi:MAG: NTP transferase domain-containing protein [Halodesulfurarchaeum sp.]